MTDMPSFSPQPKKPDSYGVVGHPIAHSLSPQIHTAFAAATSQNISYERYDIAPENFTNHVNLFFAAGGCGLNITLPHKKAAAMLVHTLSQRAKSAGAVNTLIKNLDGTLHGDNTDGAGLTADLKFLNVSIKAQRILILGAGGATRGILAPLLAQHPHSITIVNRRSDGAFELAAQFSDLGSLIAHSYESLPQSAFDLLIHATSAGLSGALPPLHADLIHEKSFCYDLGYSKNTTPFIQWAKQKGAAATAQGLGMLIEQAAESFFLWRGVRPETAAIRASLIK